MEFQGRSNHGEEKLKYNGPSAKDMLYGPCRIHYAYLDGKRVLKVQIGGYDIGRVFMDTGSGINLIYARTLKAMSISLESLRPTDCSFHGIVPGSANFPLEKIELDVCFGDSSNYRREKLEFEVMDWPS
jgi:hypothetical protein